MADLSFKDEAATAYDRAVAHVTGHFLPFLLRAGRVAPGQRVLDVATGTGISAEAALAMVGPGGHVTAADLSPAMVDRAREAYRFVVPSFETYFRPFQQGGGSSGQAYLLLDDAERRAVRDELRRDLADTGGPVAIDVELRFAAGNR